MAFNSYAYLLSLSVAVSLFWVLPPAWRRPYVLALSVGFYATWNLLFAAIPFGVCIVAYVGAMRSNRNGTGSSAATAAAIVLIVAALAFFKYRAFIGENVELVLGRGGSPLAALGGIALPLGISFYSFEAISYLVDARQRRIGSVSFMDLCLFTMFWPHLIAGPIVRIRELVPQLGFDRRLTTSDVVAGVDQLLWGLVQKNVCANALAAWVDEGFAPKAALLNSTIDNWALAMAFGLQIYFDFAAYSNMAIGAAALIGVRLPRNFRFPYHAANPADFWSRWHMTLSRWIRDYLFFPLASRFADSAAGLYASVIGVMALVGLWHGASWGFVAWGVMHGIYLVLYRGWERVSSVRVRESRAAKTGWRILTLVAVALAWIPFRAGTLNQAMHMLRPMTYAWNPGFSFSVNFYLVTLLLAAWCLVEPYAARLWASWQATVERLPSIVVANMYVVRPLLYATALLLFMIFDDLDTQFIYFQF